MSNNLEDKKFLLKSYSWVAFANIITKPFWFLLFIIAARILGKEQFGYYILATSIVVISSIFIDFGLDFIASREISRDHSKGESYLNKVFQTRIFFLTAIFIILSVFYISEGKINSIEYYSVLMVLIFQTLTLLLQFFKTVVSSFHNFNLFSKMMIIEKFMIILFGFISLYLYADLILFLLALIIANTITFIYFLIKIRKTFNLVLEQFKFSLVKETIIEALPLLLTVVFSVVYFRADVIILN
ncbi:MAG: oligosaccharide flippase family protein, partial [Syntrophothermus sp.]